MEENSVYFGYAWKDQSTAFIYLDLNNLDP